MFLWWVEDSPRLRPETREIVARAELVFVSAASAWEAAIKVRLGKLRLDESLEKAVEESRFSKLPITFRHAEAIATLPVHHSDPFDRMLIAQAEVEGLTIVTHDRRFEPYHPRLVWA